MGKEVDPWIRLQHSAWQYRNLNCGNNLRPPDIRQQDMNSMVFPTYINPSGCSFTRNGMMPVFSPNFFDMGSGLNQLVNPMNVPSGVAAAQKRFLVLDQSGNQTNLIFSSVGTPSWNPNPSNPKSSEPCGFGGDFPANKDQINQSDETNVSDGQPSEEMHEDTEEIDALLYSDSDEDLEEEVASTGHFPAEITGSAEDVASSIILAKRRRIDSEPDASLVDTASSARTHCRKPQLNYKYNDEEDESSSVKGPPQIGTGEEEEQDLPTTPNHNHSKRLKRERIRRTVQVLRRIIPGGRGKDAMVVLDESIRYLRSLKLKAKALRATL